MSGVPWVNAKSIGLVQASLRGEKHGSVLLKPSIIEMEPFGTKCRIFFSYALFSTHRKIKIWKALGLMHILFLKFLNNMCMTDLFLLLCVQAIVFVFTFSHFILKFSYCSMIYTSHF